MHLATSGYRFHWLLQAVQVPHHEAIHNCPQTPTITPQLFEDAKMHWLISRFHREQTSCGLEGSGHRCKLAANYLRCLHRLQGLLHLTTSMHYQKRHGRFWRIWGTPSKIFKNHNNEPRAFCKKPFGPTWWNLSRIPIHWNLCCNMGETHSLWVSCWYGRSLMAAQEKWGSLGVSVLWWSLPCVIQLVTGENQLPLDAFGCPTEMILGRKCMRWPFP